VRGITLWGYIQGQIWQSEAWLVSSDSVGASERPAMQWIGEYVQGNWTPVPTPVPTATPTPTPPPTTVPTIGPASAPGNGDGLPGEYYSDSSLSTFLFTTVDPVLDMNWGGASPDSSVPTDQFSARWTGEIEATMTQTYTIYSQSDDGLRVWINNQLIIDDWNDHATSEEYEQSGTILVLSTMKTGVMRPCISGGRTCLSPGKLSRRASSIRAAHRPLHRLHNRQARQRERSGMLMKTGP